MLSKPSPLSSLHEPSPNPKRRDTVISEKVRNFREHHGKQGCDFPRTEKNYHTSPSPPAPSSPPQKTPIRKRQGGEEKNKTKQNKTQAAPLWEIKAVEMTFDTARPQLKNKGKVLGWLSLTHSLSLLTLLSNICFSFPLKQRLYLNVFYFKTHSFYLKCDPLEKVLSHIKHS